ncbi:MAG: hypothetical protein ACQKBV_02710, partial [Puniceicoccales bacterium]
AVGIVGVIRQPIIVREVEVLIRQRGEVACARLAIAHRVVALADVSVGIVGITGDVFIGQAVEAVVLPSRGSARGLDQLMAVPRGAEFILKRIVDRGLRIVNNANM